MNDVETLRRTIFNKLDERGDTLSHFAEEVGVSQPVASHWKSGISDSFSNKKYIEKIAKYFNVSTDYLLGFHRDEADAEVMDYVETLKNRDDMRMLFRVSKGATKEDIERTVKIIEALKNDSDK